MHGRPLPAARLPQGGRNGRVPAWTRHVAGLALFSLLRPLLGALPGMALALLLAVQATPAHAAMADSTVPCGGLVKRERAQTIARAAAWLAAVQQAADLLDHTAAQYGATSADQRRALASAVHRPLFSVSPAPAPLAREGQVHVSVRLDTPPRTLDSRLRAALQRPDTLELRQALLRETAAAASEGATLARRAAEARQSRGVNADAAFDQRINYLSDKLEALWILEEALTRRRATWREPAAVVRQMRRAVELDPYSALLWCALGEVQLQLDQPQHALQSLDNALNLQPDMAHALYARGLGHLRLQQTALAEADMSAALRRYPDNAAWLRARGAVRMVREDYGPMCQDFARACALGDCEGLEAARGRALCLPSALTEPGPESPPHPAAENAAEPLAPPTAETAAP